MKTDIFSFCYSGIRQTTSEAQMAISYLIDNMLYTFKRKILKITACPVMIIKTGVIPGKLPTIKRAQERN